MTFPPVLFLGAGQMAESLIRGILARDLVKPQDVMATDVRPERLDYLRSQLGIQTSTDNRGAISFGRIIVVAVKPQDVPSVLATAGPMVRRDQVLVSIAAGVPIARLEQSLSGPTAVVRVMPNTPALIGAGVAGVALGPHASSTDGELVLELLSSVGKAVLLPEYLLDAVTGLSGSGPAFVALFVEGLIDGGVRAGLPRDVATTLTLQTVLGTAQMLQAQGLHPSAMKDMVTSPGGTTIAGVHALERGGLRAALMDAVFEATERSRELGRT